MRMVLAVMAMGLAAGAAMAADAPDRQVVRGRYLVENVGMCGDCHTPRGAMGEPDLQRPLGGAGLGFAPTVAMPAWTDKAPAIAGPKALGWTRTQMVTFLVTGAAPDGSSPRPPMPAFRFTKADAEAVAAYLASLPAPLAVEKVKLGPRD